MFLYISFGSCCTNERFYNGRQYPLCAEEPMSVQFSRRFYMSVQYINSTHSWVHSIWVFLHRSSWNSFPRVVKDVLQSPGVHGARGLHNVQTCKKGKEAKRLHCPLPRPLWFISLIMSFMEQKFIILMKCEIFYFTSCTFGVIFKNSLPNLRSQWFSPMFSSNNFRVLHFIFRSIIFWDNVLG